MHHINWYELLCQFYGIYVEMNRIGRIDELLPKDETLPSKIWSIHPDSNVWLRILNETSDCLMGSWKPSTR